MRRYFLLRPSGAAVCVTALALAACAGIRAVYAQDGVESDTSVVHVYVDKQQEGELRNGPSDSLYADTAAILDSIRTAGYYFATIDSSVGNTLFISEGPLFRLGRIDIRGVDESEARAIRRDLNSREGRVLDADVLEDDLLRILTRYDALGHPLTAASVEELSAMQDGSIRLTLHIDPGPRLHLERIELPGAQRTSSASVSRLTGIRTGSVLGSFQPEVIHRRLEETGLFEHVGFPELVIEPDSVAVLVIPLEEADPGSFDLVIGYLPPQIQGENGSLVGSGHLELRNVVGGGRRLAIRLNRLPNQVSSLDLEAADPFLFGLPLGVEGRFHGLEQDSTYGKQSYHAEVAYRFEQGISAFAGFSREVTRPGQAGLRYAENGRQVVPRSDAWFLGMGVRMEKLDRRINPSNGYFIEMNLESGRKEFMDRRIVGPDTSSIIHLLDQRRLQAGGRLFLPTFARQVLVVGGEGRLLLSDAYDRSDLFRFGGATSLRGYDEDRFLGRIVTRALVEYRLQIDRLAFAYIFFDLGYVDRPETPDVVESRGFHPGYGTGIQFRTALGLVNVSAAFNPDSGPTDARIHAGLSFGL